MVVLLPSARAQEKDSKAKNDVEKARLEVKEIEKQLHKLGEQFKSTIKSLHRARARLAELEGKSRPKTEKKGYGYWGGHWAGHHHFGTPTWVHHGSRHHYAMHHQAMHHQAMHHHGHHSHHAYQHMREMEKKIDLLSKKVKELERRVKSK